MSTMKVTNLKHESSSVNNIVLNSDGSVGGELATTLASKGDITTNGSWTAFTPTFSGGTWAVGNGTFTGTAYVQVGKIVFYKGLFTFGSTTVKDAAAGLSISLPVAGQAGVQGGGEVVFLDSGTAYYQASFILGATTFTPLATTATIGTLQAVVSTTPFTWATSDVIRWAFFYEAA